MTKPSADEDRSAEHVTVLTRAASTRGRLPQALPGSPVGSLISGCTSRLDAFSAYHDQT